MVIRNKVCGCGVVFLTALQLVSALPAEALTTCTFTTVVSTWRLDADCTTDETIKVPDGFTLDGQGHTITAMDPSGGHFTGAVVANGGAIAHVKNLTVTTWLLANVCDGGPARLRGIMFEGTSGSIAYNHVLAINQGPSGCQEGTAVEVRNAPFDGTHPGTKMVEIAHNDVLDYQKTGILANGDVSVSVHHNKVGASSTRRPIASSSVSARWAQ